MSSRKDQVQAHAYVRSRLTSALVHADPDAPESPLRRTGIGSIVGIALGALGVVGFLVWGLISPPAKAGALTAGELVMAKQTGARYIYADKALRPVLNWSSAMLLMGGNSAMTAVSATALDGVPQGQPLGIVGAPDSLPAVSALNTGAWLACTRASGGQTVVSVSIDAAPPVSGVPSGSAVVVAAAGAKYLLWHGQRLRVDAPWILDALGLNRAPVVQTAPVWLNAVPAGPDLEPLSVANAGATGVDLSGLRTRVGQILVVHNVGSASQLYLVMSGGVMPVTSTQAAILLSDRATAAAYPGTTSAPVPVSPAAIAQAPIVRAGLADGSGLPPAPPADYAPGGSAVPCMDYAAKGGTPAQLVFAVPPAGSPPQLGTPGVTDSPDGAGLISVVPGGGALVRPEAAPGVGGDSLFLVTDTGIKYPVPAANVTSLGYRTGQAAALPASLLSLLPTGPALDLAPLRG